MYSFYVVRGHTLDYLESLSPIEQRFYMISMDEYYIDEAVKFGGDRDKIERDIEMEKINELNKHKPN